MVSAVILAGGSVKPDLKAQFDIPTKAMIPLLGKTAADFVVEATRACPRIGKVAMAGCDALRALPVASQVDAFVTDAGRIPANLIAGMEALGEMNGAGVMVAGDSPLLSAATLDNFLAQVPEDCDMCYPAVRKDAILAAFPDREWTFIPFKESPVVCTNVMYFRASLLRSFEAFADQIEVARRKPWKLASLFGPLLFARFMLGRLSIKSAERRISYLLKARCCGVLSDDPLLAMDLDDSRDLPFVEGYLRQHAS